MRGLPPCRRSVPRVGDVLRDELRGGEEELLFFWCECELQDLDDSLAADDRGKAERCLRDPAEVGARRGNR